MKVQNLSVKRLFGRVAIGLVLSMSGITIVLFFLTKQTAVLLHDLVEPCQTVPNSGKLGFAVLWALGRFIPGDHVV